MWQTADTGALQRTVDAQRTVAKCEVYALLFVLGMDRAFL